jgi:hypothetical protein
MGDRVEGAFPSSVTFDRGMREDYNLLVCIKTLFSEGIALSWNDATSAF